MATQDDGWTTDTISSYTGNCILSLPVMTPSEVTGGRGFTSFLCLSINMATVKSTPTHNVRRMAKAPVEAASPVHPICMIVNGINYNVNVN